MPEVSVVIPTARGGAYLRQAVGSVLAQTFSDFELIVVADGCPDDLADLEGLDPRIAVLRQARRGASVARNVGIRAARAELIAFLDDDDAMRPARLQAQHGAMDGQPGIALCYTQFVVVDDRAAAGPAHGREVDYLDLLRGELGVLMPTTMMRKSLLQEVGLFDADLVMAEDVDVMLRLALSYRLVFLPAALTEYRQHENNSSGDTRIAGKMLESVIAKHLALAQQLGRADAVAAAQVGVRRMRGFASAGCVLETREAWKKRDLSRLCTSLVAAVRLSPSTAGDDLLGNRWPFGILFKRRTGRR